MPMLTSRHALGKSTTYIYRNSAPRALPASGSGINLTSTLSTTSATKLQLTFMDALMELLIINLFESLSGTLAEQNQLKPAYFARKVLNESVK